jgi:hypothetical protein
MSFFLSLLSSFLICTINVGLNPKSVNSTFVKIGLYWAIAH